MAVRRGQGQWALGYREPLNPNERIKHDDDGLRPPADHGHLPPHRLRRHRPGDLRGRLRWCGLYTQRRPGIAGGRTAILEPEELDDEYFMLRIRIDGGALTSEQLRVIGDISTDVRAGTSPTSPTGRTSSCTGSGSRTSRRSGSGSRRSGCRPTEACGDTPRVMLGCPLAGVAADEIIDADAGRCGRSASGYIGDPEFSNLPRKFKTAISRLRAALHVATRSTTSPSSASISPDGTARLRPLGRRRPVHQPDARPAARRLRRARRGGRGLGRRRLDLPRLRLPPAAQPRPAEVPGRRLGRGEVPRGARDGVPRPRRCPTARRPTAPGRAPRPRRRARAEGRPVLRRRRTTGPAGSRGTSCTALADLAERARRRPGAAHRRSRSSSCSTSTPTRSSAVVAALDDTGPVGAARRRSGAARWPAPASSSASWRSSRPRAAPRRSSTELERRLPDFDDADHDQRQRLPQLLRPVPGRRHRPQGHGA